MKRIFGVCSLYVILGFGLANAHGQTIQTIALSGQSVLGTSLSASGFGLPEIDSAGQVYFAAGLAGPGVTMINNTGLLLGNADSLELVAREWGPPPGYHHGAQGMFFQEFDINFPKGHFVSAYGKTIVRGRVVGSDENNSFHNGQALWYSEPNGLELIAGVGKHVPGVSDVVVPGPGPVALTEFVTFEPPVINTAGQIAFLARLDPAIIFNARGIWTDVSGTLQLAAREGEQVAGMPAGVTFFEIRNPSLNKAGNLAFSAAIKEPDPLSPAKEAVMVGTLGAFMPIVREGDAVPGTQAGVTFDHFQLPFVDDAGRVLFQAELVGADVDDTNSEGIWRNSAGTTTLIARTGSQAPSMPAGVNFASLSIPTKTAAGGFAFNADLAGPGIDAMNNSGIWSGTPDDLNLVVQKGDQASGLHPGNEFTFVSLLAQTQDGRVAFHGRFPGVLPNTGPNHGIWAEDAHGNIVSIVKSGDVLEVAPGDFRTVSTVAFGDMNERGQITFRAQFGSFSDVTNGIFVSNLVAIPEPTSLAVIAIGFLAIVVTRRVG